MKSQDVGTIYKMIAS